MTLLQIVELWLLSRGLSTFHCLIRAVVLAALTMRLAGHHRMAFIRAVFKAGYRAVAFK